ncbi:hypothetical protein [Clostridium sp. 'White wine YQ']|uniref:hypothetical protein n=1 Tax=Clostridium sp. 'White wine YQ' TaxID=3027474 RepID=UPI00236622AD|nr:hypothetical protein [Clostridium sp. 'White wine YQ']MDD7794106.1 hypothetical protein [Clostridium sp. 'White wine YQ']
MKKFLNWALILCTVITGQLLYGNKVSAKEMDKKSPIPMVVKVEQTAPNQIQVTYDRDVDTKLGSKITNYWIQDTKNDTPKGIATLGKNDKVNQNNSLKDNLAKINPVASSQKTFVITFNQSIPKGEEYKVIVCYVTVPGAPAFTGDNGMGTFIGK